MGDKAYFATLTAMMLATASAGCGSSSAGSAGSAGSAANGGSAGSAGPAGPSGSAGSAGSAANGGSAGAAGGGGSTGSGVTEVTVVAKDGGTVSAANGEMALVIPPGSLKIDTEIEIRIVPRSEWPEAIALSNPVGAVYEILPDGTLFDPPAKMVVNYDEEASAMLQSGEGNEGLFAWTLTDEQTLESTGEPEIVYTVGSAAVTLSVELLHLSFHWTSPARVGKGGTNLGADLGGKRYLVGESWTGKAIFRNDLTVEQLEILGQPGFLSGFTYTQGLGSVGPDFWSEDLGQFQAGQVREWEPVFTCKYVGKGKATVGANYSSAYFREGTTHNFGNARLKLENDVTCYKKCAIVPAEGDLPDECETDANCAANQRCDDEFVVCKCECDKSKGAACEQDKDCGDKRECTQGCECQCSKRNGAGCVVDEDCLPGLLCDQEACECVGEEGEAPEEEPEETGKCETSDDALGCSIDVFADPCAHQEFIGAQPGTLGVSVNSSCQIVITGEAPFVDVSGNLDPTTGVVTATGAGIVAENSGIGVSHSGAFSGGSLSGTYSQGTMGGLPGGCAIDYSVSCSP